MKWFKKDFFSWCQKPACTNCGKGKGAQEAIGQAKPTAEEQQGWAGTVEVYKCKECGHVHRFPRYNNPATLLTTRTGRCGEWANAFTLMCRAMGYEARHTLDWTDHVWTEVWSVEQGRWLHADPCENRLDKPLMYEGGWNKKLVSSATLGPI